MPARLKYFANRCEHLFKIANAVEFKDQTTPTLLEWKKRSVLYAEACALAAVLSDLEKNVCPLLKELRGVSLPTKAAGMLNKVLEDFDWAKEHLYDEEELKSRSNPNTLFGRR
jgi:hypothetical protein